MFPPRDHARHIVLRHDPHSGTSASDLGLWAFLLVMGGTGGEHTRALVLWFWCGSQTSVRALGQASRSLLLATGGFWCDKCRDYVLCRARRLVTYPGSDLRSVLRINSSCHMHRLVQLDNMHPMPGRAVRILLGHYRLCPCDPCQAARDIRIIWR